MEGRTTEREYYVVCRDDKDRLWQATTIIGKTPSVAEPKKIVGTLPKMTPRELSDYFGIEYSTVYRMACHIETKINRKIREAGFYEAEGRRHYISLRLAISTRYCPACDRQVVRTKINGTTHFQCLYCDKFLRARETVIKRSIIWATGKA